MREIKFRSYVQSKGMFYFTIDELLSSTVHSEGVTYSGGDMTYVWSREDAVKMQYTGLKDKNGKEIYEGDMVQEKITEETVYTYEVRFGEYDNGMDWEDYVRGIGWYLAWEGSDDSFEDIYGKADKLEVIGNIYENQELLSNKLKDRQDEKEQ